jgi:23S rRNA (adenine2503-C2)-methyltransferase
VISFEQLRTATKDWPAYRSRQIYRAIFINACESWEEATDLPSALRAELAKDVPLGIDCEILLSADGLTSKAVIRLAEGGETETVLMRHKGRNTVCVSTQVGCAMGCAFCASGKDGLARNLSVDEIIEQVLLFVRTLRAQGAKVNNIVFMGIGEPLQNYSNVIAAIRFLNRPDTLNLGIRKFSLSTCGHGSGIRRLARETAFDVNLAVSLHSAIDEKRAALMPKVGKGSTLTLAGDLKQYFARTKRKIMIEYVLIEGMNTSREEAAALRGFIDATGAAYVVNLIPLNGTLGGFQAPGPAETAGFKRYLDERGIGYVQRFAFGRDIKGTCGSLGTGGTQNAR